MYSSTIFSKVYKLFNGLKDSISNMGFPLLCVGIIFVILNILGKIHAIIIAFVRWVIIGANFHLHFLITSIVISSWPVAWEFGILFIISIISLVLASGILKSSFVLGKINDKILSGQILEGLKLFLIFRIISI